MTRMFQTIVAALALFTVTLSTNAATIDGTLDIDLTNLLNLQKSTIGNAGTLSFNSGGPSSVSGSINQSPVKATAVSVADISYPLNTTASIPSFWSITTDSNDTYKFDLETIDYAPTPIFTGQAFSLVLHGFGTVSDALTSDLAEITVTINMLKDSRGNWSSKYSSFTASAVPIPAAGWLFGSALVGLVGVARRKTRT